MGTLKGRNSANDAWVNASVVYGYDSAGVKTYAKQASVRNSTNTGWERAWTDCRQHDATGGRDWSSSSSSTTVTCTSCSCGTNTRVDTTVTYTKTGCPTYTRSTTGTCTGCTATISQGAGTYTTSDGVTATYRVESDWLGYSSYLVPNTCSSPGCAGCSCDQLIGYGISYCPVTGVFTRSSGTCFKWITFCP